MKLSFDTIKPYADNDLVYDSHYHRYKIAPTNPLIDTTIYDNADKISKATYKISARIYNFILTNCNAYNRDIVELAINCTEEGRFMIKQALESQLEADQESGMSDIVNENAVDFARGTILDRQQIRQNRICIESESIIRNCMKPFNILYQGDLGFRLSIDRYTKWEY